MRVLLAEDHVELAETLATVLRREGMAVDVAFDGRDARARTSANRYDVVVLDLMAAVLPRAGSRPGHWAHGRSWFLRGGQPRLVRQVG